MALVGGPGPEGQGEAEVRLRSGAGKVWPRDPPEPGGAPPGTAVGDGNTEGKVGTAGAGGSPAQQVAGGLQAAERSPDKARPCGLSGLSCEGRPAQGQEPSAAPARPAGAALAPRQGAQGAGTSGRRTSGGRRRTIGPRRRPAPSSWSSWLGRCRRGLGEGGCRRRLGGASVGTWAPSQPVFKGRRASGAARGGGLPGARGSLARLSEARRAWGRAGPFPGAAPLPSPCAHGPLPHARGTQAQGQGVRVPGALHVLSRGATVPRRLSAPSGARSAAPLLGLDSGARPTRGPARPALWSRTGGPVCAGARGWGWGRGGGGLRAGAATGAAGLRAGAESGATGSPGRGRAGLVATNQRPGGAARGPAQAHWVAWG